MSTDMDQRLTLTEALTEISNLSAFESSIDSRTWIPSTTPPQQPSAASAPRTDAQAKETLELSPATTCHSSSPAGTLSSMLSLSMEEWEEESRPAEVSPSAGGASRRQPVESRGEAEKAEHSVEGDALLQLLDLRGTFCFDKPSVRHVGEALGAGAKEADRPTSKSSDSHQKRAAGRDATHFDHLKGTRDAPKNIRADALDEVLMQKTLASLAGSASLPQLPSSSSISLSRQGTPSSFSVSRGPRWVPLQEAIDPYNVPR
ncbi:unnamed protein product, partial [Symbiodinium pilosum]